MNETRWFALGILVLALLVFREVLAPGQALFTTDDNLGQLMARKNGLPHDWFGGWRNIELLGYPVSIDFNLTNLLLYIFPASLFNNWINAFDLAVGSFFLFLFLRGRGLAWPACALGLLTAYWVGSNFTLVYAGHIGKFGILLWVPCFLWLTDIAIREKSVTRAILAGGAMGAMFLEQADVALFFALAIGSYVLFAWWRTQDNAWPGSARILVPLFGTAFLLAVHPLLAGYQTAVEGVAAIQEDGQAKWDFATQWSWPPEESIDFIAPGYTGWRTGEPDGPYTGRMGRSANWEETGQGFQNFKLENQYIGAIPILFALVAVYVAIRRRDGHWRDVFFWGAVTLIALLLSFGKYFPLYALFYQLPLISSIRNPNKFLQVFQFALAIVAAYGLQSVWMHKIVQKRRIEDHVNWKPLLYGAISVAAILFLWALTSVRGSNTVISSLQPQWGAYARVIVDTRVAALFHGSAMAFLAAVGLFLLTRDHISPRTPRLVACGLIGLMVFDVLWLSRHYVKTFEAGSLTPNPVLEMVQETQDGSRVALVSQDGFYNYWLSILFPYLEVESINVAQMPRMPLEYERYLNAVARNPLRHWELGAVGWVLAPAEIWGQIGNDPALRARFSLQYAYNVEPAGGGVNVIPATEQRRGAHVVLRHMAPHHRYALIRGWDIIDDDAALRLLSSSDFIPYQRLLVSSSQDDTHWLPAAPTGARGVLGEITRMDFRAGLHRLRVVNEEPAMLRIAEKFDPHWKVTVNEEHAPLWRVDYLMQGVYLESGVHVVELRYNPPRHTLWAQVFGMLICLTGAGGWIVDRRRMHID